MGITRDQLDSEIRALFSEARTNGGLEYIYTLVRVEGLTHQRDPLEELRRD